MASNGGTRMSSDGAPAPHIAIPLTPLIGRARELDRVAERLRQSRLVTVSGPGGVGKTRLAVDVAHRYGDGAPDDVRFIDLAAIPIGGDVAAAVARTLDIGGVA